MAFDFASLKPEKLEHPIVASTWIAAERFMLPRATSKITRCWLGVGVSPKGVHSPNVAVWGVLQTPEWARIYVPLVLRNGLRTSGVCDSRTPRRGV